MPTHFRGTAHQARALNAYICLMRAAESLTARLVPLMGGLTPSQFGTLEALLHLGPLAQRDLGRKLLKSGGNVTMVVDNLEARALVRRTRGPRDRRVVTVALTPAGRRLIRSLFPRHVRGIVEEMKCLTAREQDALRALCRRLGRKEKP